MWVSKTLKSNFSDENIYGAVKVCLSWYDAVPDIS